MANDYYLPEFHDNDGYYEQVMQEQEWHVDSHYKYPHINLNTKRNMNMDINSMSFNQLVPSNSSYLSKDDVGEDGVILTIKGFKMETIKGDDGDEEKMVMYFDEDFKPMIINRTNSRLIGIATGAANAGEARGKQVVVYNDATISFGGKVTGGIRIKKVAGAPRQAVVAAQPGNTDFDDLDQPPF